MSKGSSEQKLTSALLSAAGDPSEWGNALALLARDCGALAGIITLRSSKTAEIVISTEIETEFHTPYVGGFPHEMVKTYVESFRSNDPWSKIQAHTHPHIPLLMSNHLPISEFEKTDFGKWVSKDAFNDTVVTEIGHSKNHWTALNLYFMNQDKHAAEKILDGLRERLSNVKRAWSLSRKLQQSQVIEGQFLAHVENSPRAIILVDAEDRVTALSQAAKRLLELGVAKVCHRSRKLEFSSLVSWKGETFRSGTAFETEEALGQGYYAKIDRTLPSSLSTGEEVGLSLITFTHWRDDGIEPWNQDCLTEREKLMVLTIAETNRIQASAEVLRVGERRNRQIWNRVREKLDGITKAEIVAIYQKARNQKIISRQ